MSAVVVVTSRHTRKTSVSIYTIVPRYTIPTLLLNDVLAWTGGAWRLLGCGLCFLLATRNVPDGPICTRTRKKTGLFVFLGFEAIAAFRSVALSLL